MCGFVWICVDLCVCVECSMIPRVYVCAVPCVLFCGGTLASHLIFAPCCQLCLGMCGSISVRFCVYLLMDM